MDHHFDFLNLPIDVSRHFKGLCELIDLAPSATRFRLMDARSYASKRES